MCQYVAFQVRRLCKLLVATIERTDVWPVSRMNPNVSPETKSKYNILVPHPKEQVRNPIMSQIGNQNCRLGTHLRLKSRLNRLPHPSNVHWKGFSPVCTSWWRLSLLDSTNAFPHSAQTCTRGPCVCRCLRIAELSLNILLHPLCGHAKKDNKKAWLNWH